MRLTLAKQAAGTFIVLAAALTTGCKDKPPVQHLSAGMAEYEASREAMRHHPSLLAHDRAAAGAVKAARLK